MYYEIYIYTEGKAKDDFIRHLYNNGYNFSEAKHNENVIFVLEDELSYVQTVADENGIEINVCNV